ncbi:MAG: hypothetical protein ACK4M7_10295, partial [Burkholderiales bacterium]
IQIGPAGAFRSCVWLWSKNRENIVVNDALVKFKANLNFLDCISVDDSGLVYQYSFTPGIAFRKKEHYCSLKQISLDYNFVKAIWVRCAIFGSEFKGTCNLVFAKSVTRGVKMGHLRR